MFVAYPSISEPGPDPLQRSLGGGVLRWIYAALGVLIIGAYVGAAVLSRSKSDVAVNWSMAVGIAVGTVAALVTSSVGVASRAASTGELGVAGWVLALSLLIAPIVAGALGVVSYRGTSDPREEVAGALAGFWCSMAFCLVVATIGLASLLAQADHLAHTAWAGGTSSTPVSRYQVGYQIGDELGFTGFFLTLGPLFGLAGVVGGAAASALFPIRTDAGQGPRSRRAEWVALGFLGVMGALTIVRMATHL